MLWVGVEFVFIEPIFGAILNYGDYNIQWICLFDERFYLVKVILI
ncbi:hypothetical protein [Plasmodium yoelii yoelii]|uniref:Uncharacterized protein n=1 Tax=Plasmodium yoelii yoelii TaxID=73239 RepID=Q7RFD5_PLAYO|nr:hypothetical protein [Plasmodium yoelii yoelii]